MTTPEIDVAPSTVEGGDKSGANSPVDAAPPKDPIGEFERLVDEFDVAAREYGWAEDQGTDRHVDESRAALVSSRTALLSAVASLRARAEEAEDDRYHLQGRLKEACARHERVASSLERMRERVAGLIDASAQLHDAAYWLEQQVGWRCAHEDPPPPDRSEVQRACDAIRPILSALRSPSTPETKDEHR